MKKYALFFSLILIAQSAHAFVENEYMRTEQYLVNTGYSKEMAKMISVTAENPYREPYVEGKTFKDKIRRLSAWLIPTTEADIDFYNHNIQYNNPSWKDL